jgi:hypothetical protein
MNPLNLITEPYDRQARLYPALLLIAPVVATGVAVFSAHLSGVQSLGAFLVGLGGAFLLTQLARDAGKKGEKSLFEKWGGLPSVAIFRHRDTRLDPITKLRYHKKLASLVKEAKAPTAEQEQTDPDGADAVYSAWSNYLRVNSRDTKKFGMLFHENVSYGYRRNVWGLRPIGIFVSSVSLVVCVTRVCYLYQSTEKWDEALLGGSAFALLMLLLWVLRFTGDWARVPADAYAARLAECAEILGAKEIPPRTPAKKATPKSKGT